jgi:hypothetical protein
MDTSEGHVRMSNGKRNFPACWLYSKTDRFNASDPSTACALPTCLGAELDISEGRGDRADCVLRDDPSQLGRCVRVESLKRKCYNDTGSDLYSSVWHKLAIK